MPNTYTLLETITVGAAGASSVTFNSIPQTGYTDLVLNSSIRCTAAEDTAFLRFNNDSATNYSYRRLIGDGSSAASSTATSQAQLALQFMAESGYTANTFSNNAVYIPNYTSSNTKSVSFDSVNERNASNPRMLIAAGLWSGTAAITTMQVLPGAGNFAQYSTFSLYGVSALGTTPTKAPKATGGSIIQTDGTYWYHAFLSSGTFTPATGLSCDYLVVAGGAGSSELGGGGGAGGLRSTVTATGGGGSLESALSLASGTGYTVTIGAGGAGVTTPTAAGANGSNSVFSTITSTGGGGGSIYDLSGVAGGSGGGSGRGSGTGGARTTNQGFAGGAGGGFGGVGCAGGGGAGAVGANATSSTVSGNGGVGVQISALATTTGTGANSGYYAGGGGGGSGNSNTAGTGGLGGGASGKNSNGGTSDSGVANTGGGGAGGSAGGGTGGSGGSGIVIIRYLA